MTTLNAYRVSNRASAIVLGIFLAEDHAAALDASAVRAGYKSRADIPDEIRANDDEIDVVNVESDIDFVVDHVIDGIEKNREYNDGYYSGWDDGRQAREIYCDFSSWIDDLGANEQRIKDILEDSDAADIIDARIDKWLNEAKTHERTGIVDNVKHAEDLYDLQKSLKAADKFASQAHVDAGSLYAAAALRTYGGSKPKNGSAIYPVISFDEDNVLVRHAGRWDIMSRDHYASVA